MSFDYIEKAYGKRFRRGMRVLALGKPGVVTTATHYVNVRLDGLRHANPYHPADVVPEPTDTVLDQKADADERDAKGES